MLGWSRLYPNQGSWIRFMFSRNFLILDVSRPWPNKGSYELEKYFHEIFDARLIQTLTKLRFMNQINVFTQFMMLHKLNNPFSWNHLALLNGISLFITIFTLIWQWVDKVKTFNWKESKLKSLILWFFREIKEIPFETYK